MSPDFSSRPAAGARVRYAGIAGIVALLTWLLAPSISWSAPSSANTVVLVNSASGRYLDFRNYIQPYLDHFGIPYSVLDVRTNEVGPSLTNFALIVVGHAQLDTNHLYLSSLEQSNVVQAVAAGTGLVNFDSVVAGSGVLTNYQYVQDLFGFTYPGGDTGNYLYETTFFPTEPEAQFHYILSRRPTTNTIIAYRTAITLLNVNAPGDVKVLARSNEPGLPGQPLLSVKSFGAGRAVQWGSYDWMKMSVRGPVGGMDGLVWRSLIWAARKPFVMRGMPNFVSLRVDDTHGPHWWLQVANEVGFKPWVGPFITSMPTTNIAELRQHATNGLCTVSVHSFTPGDFTFYNHDAQTSWSNVEISNRMYHARQWHLTNGIPISKVIVPHTSEAGLNAYPWFKQWGVEYLTLVNEPGMPRNTPWLVAGPFRKFVPTEPAPDLRPLCYADYLNIPGYPELAGQFFNCTTIIKDDSVDGEWGPNNDVAATAARGVRQLKRSFDSLAQGVLWTHEAYISYIGIGPVYTPSITTNNWRAILQSITNDLASYQPQYVTLDYSCKYVRATRTAKIISAAFDPVSSQMSMTFTGRADLELSVQIYHGADNAISNVTATIPAFTNSIVVAAAAFSAPPTITVHPQSQTTNAGAGVTFAVSATGSTPFTYQWRFNETNIVAATNAGFSLVSVTATNAGNYSVSITNLTGAVISSNALLTVILPPAITNGPQSQTVLIGTNVTLTVGATGTEPITYQWRKNATNFTVTSVNTLVLTNVQTGDAGDYSVILTNAAGSATSAVAVVSINLPPPPPPLLKGSRQGNLFLISFASTPGYTYVIERRAALETGAWLVLTNLAAIATNSIASDIINAPKQFYRVRLAGLTPEQIRLSGGIQGSSFVLEFNARTGRSYTIEYTGGVGVWSPLTNLTAQSTNVIFADPVISTQRYYRVRTPAN